MTTDNLRHVIWGAITAVIGFLVFAAVTKADEPGIGAYAAMHPQWPCKRLMAGFDGSKDLNLSVLYNTFGTSWNCLDRWAADSRPKKLEVHLINEVCQRNARCGSYEFLYGMSVDQYKSRIESATPKLLERITNYAAPVSQWFANHEDVACYVSPGLESNLSKKGFKILAEHLKPLFPERCKFVWSPVGHSAYSTAIPDYVHELHGDGPSLKPPCIANLDGVDINMISRPAILSQFIQHTEVPRYRAAYSSCDSTFLWIAEFNGIGRGAFIDPRKRTNFPSDKVMSEIKKFITDAPPKPVPPWTAEDDLSKQGCARFAPIQDGYKKGVLWKQSDVDIYGAVALLPRKEQFKSVTVVKKGKVIEVMKFAYRYTEDGSNRQVWRSNRKAEDYPYNVVLKADKLCYIIENPKVRND